MRLASLYRCSSWRHPGTYRRNQESASLVTWSIYWNVLTIEVVEGFAVRKGDQYNINACGCVESLRKRNDGCTVFGNVLNNEKGEVINDVVIPAIDDGIGKRHMVIKYRLDDRSYYLRDLGDGSGTFVRIDKELVRLIFNFSLWKTGISFHLETRTC